MITKQDILKMIKGVSQHARGRKSGSVVNAERDWSLGVIGFVVLLVAVSFYGVQGFFFYLNIEQQLSLTEIAVPNYNTQDMDKIIEIYSSRKEEYDSLRASFKDKPRTAADSQVGSASGPALAE